MRRKPLLAARSEVNSARVSERLPQNHRTVDRVTHILEEVVYSPGMTLAELVRVLGAPKSSVHGFIRGLLAKGGLHQEQHRFYLGPAVYEPLCRIDCSTRHIEGQLAREWRA